MTATPLPPNKEGATQCIVRWQVETAAGWLGAYNKDAFEAYATAARADLEAENKRLREALRIAHDHIDMNALRVSHCKDAATITAALKGSNHD